MAVRLAHGKEELEEVHGINITPFIAEALKHDQWLFVDRIHFTDQGHDFVSKLILDVI